MVARRRRWGLVFAAPGAIFFAAFALYPLIDAFVVSLERWNLLLPPVYAGLQNYVLVFTDPTFWQALLNTVIFLAGTYIPANVLGLILAALLNARFPLRGLYRTLFFIPAVTSQVVAAVMWLLIYNQNGPVNAVLADLGIPAIPWLFSNWAMPAIILMTVWASIGYFAVLYLAGLQSVSEDVLEAASIDGAGPLQRFLRVTIPLLRNTVTFCLITSVVQGLTVFIPEMMLTNGGPNNDTMVLSLMVYNDGFVYLNMGKAAAIAVVIFVLAMGATLFSLRRILLGSRAAA